MGGGVHPPVGSRGVKAQANITKTLGVDLGLVQLLRVGFVQLAVNNGSGSCCGVSSTAALFVS
jgi:hypothetical protein